MYLLIIYYTILCRYVIDKNKPTYRHRTYYRLGSEVGGTRIRTHLIVELSALVYLRRPQLQRHLGDGGTDGGIEVVVDLSGRFQAGKEVAHDAPEDGQIFGEELGNVGVLQRVHEDVRLFPFVDLGVTARHGGDGKR